MQTAQINRGLHIKSSCALHRELFLNITIMSRNLLHLPHICKFPSRYSLAYSSGSSMASVFNAQSDPGVVLKFFLLPSSQCEAYSLHWYKHQCCFVRDYILQIVFSSYLISLSFNQLFATKTRSISISSPCHFYFVLYCFI